MRLEKIKVLAGSVRRLLRRDASSHVINLLAKLRSGDISNILLELADRDQRAVFTLLMRHDKQQAAEALNTLGVEVGLDLLLVLPASEIASVLQELETDDQAVFIAALPEEVSEKVLEAMRVEESAEVQGLLQHEEETAGRIMTPNVFSLEENVSVSEAIDTIQTTRDLEMVFYLYVIDSRSHLVGVVSLRQLITASPSTPLKNVMTTDVIGVRTHTDQEEVARQVALYDLLAIPVVDRENKLVGVITVDDVIDVIKEEATEDILYLAGVEADDRIHTNARNSVRKRLPWLMANLVLALLAATVVAYYEPTIAALPLLAIFLPVVAGMGGNSGTQALAVVVRGLALGEVSWETARTVLSKETLVSVANGVTLGLLAGLIAFFWKGSFVLGLVLGIALVANIFVAGLAGSLVPLLFKKIGVDPAIASGIFLHTFTDVVGFFAFLALAAAFLL